MDKSMLRVSMPVRAQPKNKRGAPRRPMRVCLVGDDDARDDQVAPNNVVSTSTLVPGGASGAKGVGALGRTSAACSFPLHVAGRGHGATDGTIYVDTRSRFHEGDGTDSDGDGDSEGSDTDSGDVENEDDRTGDEGGRGDESDSDNDAKAGALNDDGYNGTAATSTVEVRNVKQRDGRAHDLAPSPPHHEGAVRPHDWPGARGQCTFETPLGQAPTKGSNHLDAMDHPRDLLRMPGNMVDAIDSSDNDDRVDADGDDKESKDDTPGAVLTGDNDKPDVDTHDDSDNDVDSDGNSSGDDDDDDDDVDDEYVERHETKAQEKKRGSGDTGSRDLTWLRARVPASQRVPLDDDLVAKAHAGTLLPSDLTGIDPTGAFRLATVDAARPIVERWWGHPLRGLPMVAGPEPTAPYALLPHQVDALTWMRGREALAPGRVYGLRGGVLSMRMGLGKTPTALALALTAPRGEMPTLIVCSRPVLKEWHTSGVAKFFNAVDATGAPIVRALYFHSDYMSTTAMRGVDRQTLANYDFVLTTYDVCAAECRRGHYDEDCLERGPKGRITVIHTRARARADRPDLVGTAVLYGTCWERIICDESQRFANPTTGIYRAMMALYGRYKWCLTGTPIRNSHTDIWAQLRFVGYTAIAAASVWKRDGPTFYTRHRLAEAVLVVGHQDRSDDPVGASTAQTRATGSGACSSNATVRTDVASTATTTTTAQAETAPALPRLPPLLHREIMVTLSAPERATYDVVQGLARSAVDDARAHTTNFACVMAMFTRLRQVAVAAHIMTVGKDTVTHDSIMRALRRADDALSGAPAAAAAAARTDPGSRPPSATPATTLTMSLEACHQRHAVSNTMPSLLSPDVPGGHLSTTTKGPPTNGHAHAPTPVEVDAVTSRSTMSTDAAGRSVTVTTVARPRYPGAPQSMTTTTTTTTATTRLTTMAGSTGARATGAPGLLQVAPDPNVIRVDTRRRLPPSMTSGMSSSSSSSSSTPTLTPGSSANAPVVEILDEEDDPTEAAADSAREASMGLVMWCQSRKSRAGTRSAKMRAVTRILAQIPPDEKALVFSSFAAALDLVADAIAERLPRMRVVQIDGETRKAERQDRLKRFRRAGGPRVLLMTYKVGAEGINLPEANHCLFLEPWWTSAVQEQAYSRCWRVGQQRPVTVYNIIAAGTAEQRVVWVCRDKSTTAAAYMASSAAARRAAATASQRAGESTLDLATLSRIIG